MTPAQPVLSIITVVLNNRGGLRRTIDSVRSDVTASAGTPEIEHIVFDGGSTDGTAEDLDEYRALGLRVHVESDDGIYDAMNRAAALSTGSNLLFLNSGDTLRPGAAAHMVRVLPGHAAPWSVFGAVALDRDGEERVIKNLPHSWWRHALGIQPHCHQSTVFSRDLFEMLHGHATDVDFVADFDLILRAGAIASPQEDPFLVVTYEGGGISAQRASETQMLQHRIRERRLQLNGTGSRMSLLWSRIFRARLDLARARARCRAVLSARRSERRAPRSTIECIDTRIDFGDISWASGEVAARALERDRTDVRIHLCNAYTLTVASRDVEYQKVLNTSWLNLCDGTPLAWWARPNGVPRARAIRGPSLLHRVLSDGAPVRHLFYGGTVGTARLLAVTLDETFPHVQVVQVISPPFGISEEEHAAQLRSHLTETPADIVWLGLGTPKQDRVAALAAASGTEVFVCVGAAFDFLAGTTRQAPRWLQNSGFEWSFRLATEPRRLARRYTVDAVGFLLALARFSFRKRR